MSRNSTKTVGRNNGSSPVRAQALEASQFGASCALPQSEQQNLNDYIAVRISNVLKAGFESVLQESMDRFKSKLSVHVEDAKQYNLQKVLKDYRKAAEDFEKDKAVIHRLALFKRHIREQKVQISPDTTAAYIDVIKIEQAAGYLAELSQNPKYKQICSEEIREHKDLHAQYSEIERRVLAQAFAALREPVDAIAIVCHLIYTGKDESFLKPGLQDVEEFRNLAGTLRKTPANGERFDTAYAIATISSFLEPESFGKLQLVDLFLQPDSLKLSNLPREIRILSERKAIAVSDHALETFRASGEMRVLKLMREVMNDTQDWGQIAKLVKQLEKFGLDNVKNVLDEVAQHITVERVHVKKVLELCDKQSKAEETSVEAEKGDQHEFNTENLISPAPAAAAPTQADDHEMKLLYLDELGLRDPAVIAELCDICTSASLELAQSMLSQLPENMSRKIIASNPALLDPKSDPPLSAWITEFCNAVDLSQGLEAYRIFDPVAYPQHFDSIDVLIRTTKAARMLKEVIREEYQSVSKETEKTSSLSPEEALIQKLSAMKLDGGLCFSLVYYGFWWGGVLATGNIVISTKGVQDNIESEYRKDKKAFGKMVKLLANQNVIILSGSNKADAALTLQSDPSQVRNETLRELLSFTLERRKKN